MVKEEYHVKRCRLDGHCLDPVVRGTGSVVMLRMRVCSRIYVPYADILCMRENRRAKRRDFFARVTINWQNETETRQDPGLVEDRSETGFGLRMRFPVTVGATVEIRLVNQNYVGTV